MSYYMIFLEIFMLIKFFLQKELNIANCQGQQVVYF